MLEARTAASRGTPLGFSPVARTESIEEAECVYGETLLASRIVRASKNSQFGMQMNAVNVGAVALSFVSHETEYEVACDNSQECLIIAYGAGGPAITSVNGNLIDLNRDITVIGNGARVSHIRAAQSREVVLKVPMAGIQSKLQILLDRTVTRQIVFEDCVSGESEAGALVRSTLGYIIDNIDAQPTILNNSLLAANFEELLFGVIFSLPNNFSDELLGPSQACAAPANVRRAEEYLEANAGSAVSISDVLLHVGCSKKALFNNFRKFRGYTPNEFLINARLRLAHERLIASSPADTVTSIAYESGFSHMGRFSKTYYSRYGAKPSETLRRTLGPS